MFVLGILASLIGLDRSRNPWIMSCLAGEWNEKNKSGTQYMCSSFLSPPLMLAKC